MIDSHAHLYLKEFDGDREETIARARAAGVRGVINVGIDAETTRAAVALASSHAGFFATAGIHPCTPVADLDAALAELRTVIDASREAIVAVGEIGLDYHWKDVAPAPQKEKLLRQVDLALALDLPIVIHCREALPDLLEILERAPRRSPGVFHCFAGGISDAERALALGFHISFTGNVTYPKAESLRAAARVVPLERLLLETDSPYLPPQSKRGKRNEPSFLVHTRDALAALYGTTAEELDRLTEENTRRMFRLPT